MYDELVNILLYDAGWLEQGMTQTEHDIAEHLKKAADAIEELQQTVTQMKATIIVEAQHTEMFDERDKKTLMEMVKSLPLQIILYKDEKLRWIPVTERLPEYDKWVLRYSAITEATWLAYLNSAGVWMDEQGEVHYVTHWMPLPEPPKEE